MNFLKHTYASLMILVLIGSTSIISAQSNQGTITLEILGVESENPQIAAMSEMMVGTETVVHFKDDQSLTKMNMMNGMIKIDLKIDEEQKTDMLMDAMGNKVWVETTKVESDRMKAENENPFGEMEINYDNNDTKTIAGYQCYKMIVTFPDNPGATLEAYITTEIDINAPVIQGVEMTQFQGFPLEYNFNNGMMTVSITTTSFDNAVDDAVFVLNTSGYQKMTMAELIQMSGGMGGGFGF